MFLKTIRLLLPALCALLILLAAVSCTKEGEKPRRGAAVVGQKAPDFALKDIEGKTVRLSDFAGKVVMVEFWATWCYPCKEFGPAVNKLFLKYRDRGFAVLGISVDKSSNVGAEVASFMKELGLIYQTLIDTEDVAGQYGVFSIPTSFLIDKSGMLVHKHMGYNPDLEESLRKEIEALL